MELRSLFRHVGVVDHQRMTRMHAGGADFLPLVGRLSTGDLTSIADDELRSSVLTTNKGRIVAHLLLWRGADGIELLSGAGLASAIADHIARFTFAEKIDLQATSEATFHLSLIGPQIGAVLEALDLRNPGEYKASRQEVAGAPVDLIGHDGHSPEGLSLIGSQGDRDSVRSALVEAVESAGGCSAGDQALQLWRILRGLPAAGYELTEEFNPLEAGLDQAISFTKGCYVGQEVIARLHSYKKVSRRIVGINFGESAQPPECGGALKQEGRACGVISSCTQLPDEGGWIGLGYMKLKALESDEPVTTGDGRVARIETLPFPPSTLPELLA
jgi:folate-binding protein YgfZ